MSVLPVLVEWGLTETTSAMKLLGKLGRILIKYKDVVIKSKRGKESRR